MYTKRIPVVGLLTVIILSLLAPAAEAGGNRRRCDNDRSRSLRVNIRVDRSRDRCYERPVVYRERSCHSYSYRSRPIIIERERRPIILVDEAPPVVFVQPIVAGPYFVGQLVGGDDFKFIGDDGRVYEADVDDGVIEKIELDD